MTWHHFQPIEVYNKRRGKTLIETWLWGNLEQGCYDLLKLKGIDFYVENSGEDARDNILRLSNGTSVPIYAYRYSDEFKTCVTHTLEDAHNANR